MADGFFLDHIPPDSGICGEEAPSTLAYDWQPDSIWCSGREMVQMLFAPCAMLLYSCDDVWIAAVILIQKDDETAQAAFPRFISHRMASSSTAGSI